MSGEFHNKDITGGEGEGGFDQFDQAQLGIDAGTDARVNLSTFDELGEAAGETGDRWTARMSYEMASWSDDATGDSPEAGNRTTMGGLLETSISLQEGNMEFQVNKGMVDASAAKASSTSGELGNAAKGR